MTGRKFRFGVSRREFARRDGCSEMLVQRAIGARDLEIAKEQEVKKMREAAQRIANRINRPVKGGMETMLTKHPDYFSLQDIRPAAITTKLTNRNADAYDFAAHSNPSTTHRHYDRRKVKAANATE
ncbi:hypothetical protein [Burkholderia ubonensis]|uniref:Integrase n=1 Tax=Burkholderia ubonensis TaxID=101571 RepID=A0AAW3NCA9_9BURK|nr:hypothetical protein [Burkholderia ubonensis]KVT58334.1 hypothetical protein WK53_27075 [Burkholderia ubonensis]